jgi:sodium-dependent dicarboxylate transporter 2/3/5
MSSSSGPWARRSLWIAPLAAIAVDVACILGGLPQAAAHTAGVTTLTAMWWILEPIPVPATSLIPFAMLPLLDVVDHKTVASAYGHTLILLLLGGFVLSTAMEKSGAHRRLALGMVRLVGGRGGRRLVLGFMLATAVCSMWISNTATVLMLMPVAAAVMATESESLRVPLLLGIAYAASIGGLGMSSSLAPTRSSRGRKSASSSG